MGRKKVLRPRLWVIEVSGEDGSYCNFERSTEVAARMLLDVVCNTYARRDEAVTLFDPNARVIVRRQGCALWPHTVTADWTRDRWWVSNCYDAEGACCTSRAIGLLSLGSGAAQGPG